MIQQGGQTSATFHKTSKLYDVWPGLHAASRIHKILSTLSKVIGDWGGGGGGALHLRLLFCNIICVP